VIIFFANGTAVEGSLRYWRSQPGSLSLFVKQRSCPGGKAGMAQLFAINGARGLNHDRSTS